MVEFDFEQVDHGIEIQGVYDGICVWVMKDGSLVNRFTPDMGRRYEMTEDYIKGMKENRS